MSEGLYIKIGLADDLRGLMSEEPHNKIKLVKFRVSWNFNATCGSSMCEEKIIRIL